MNVPMPRLSGSMEEGTIIAWLKQPGDPVVAGEDFAEIDSDKATMTIQAEADGAFQPLVEVGATVAVGETIATIGDPSAADDDAAAPLPDPAPPERSARPAASPLARRLAAKHGVDLDRVEASSGVRITKADVEATIAGRATEEASAAVIAAAPATPPAESRGERGGVELVALSRARQVVARRMTLAKSTIPDFSLRIEVAMAGCEQLREQAAAGGQSPVPSFNDILVLAAARALRRHPHLNASFGDAAIEVFERVNIGIAVATDDALLVPTIYDADKRSLAEIATEARRLAAAGREGGLSAAELDGGTFTISNLGMLGIDEFTAVINPPQAAILAVGALRRPEGQGSRMWVTLSCDHRVVDGADGAAFLRDLRGFLEAPGTLLL